MAVDRVQAAVRIQHLPTGEQVTISSPPHRSVHDAYPAGRKLLLSRVLHQQTDPDAHEYVYDLPDDEPYPHDLMEHRCRA